MCNIIKSKEIIVETSKILIDFGKVELIDLACYSFSICQPLPDDKILKVYFLVNDIEYPVINKCGLIVYSDQLKYKHTYSVLYSATNPHFIIKSWLPLTNYNPQAPNMAASVLSANVVKTNITEDPMWTPLLSETKIKVGTNILHDDNTKFILKKGYLYEVSTTLVTTSKNAQDINLRLRANGAPLTNTTVTDYLVANKNKLISTNFIVDAIKKDIDLKIELSSDKADADILYGQVNIISIPV